MENGFCAYGFELELYAEQRKIKTNPFLPSPRVQLSHNVKAGFYLVSKKNTVGS